MPQCALLVFDKPERYKHPLPSPAVHFLQPVDDVIAVDRQLQRRGGGVVPDVFPVAFEAARGADLW